MLCELHQLDSHRDTWFIERVMYSSYVASSATLFFSWRIRRINCYAPISSLRNSFPRCAADYWDGRDPLTMHKIASFRLLSAEGGVCVAPRGVYAAFFRVMPLWSKLYLLKWHIHCATTRDSACSVNEPLWQWSSLQPRTCARRPPRAPSTGDVYTSHCSGHRFAESVSLTFFDVFSTFETFRGFRYWLSRKSDISEMTTVVT